MRRLLIPYGVYSLPSGERLFTPSAGLTLLYGAETGLTAGPRYSIDKFGRLVTWLRAEPTQWSLTDLADTGEDLRH